MLIKSAPKSDVGLINYLVASGIAHKQGDYINRDLYLNKAREISSYKQTAVDLAQARLLLDARQINDAVAILKDLQQRAPKSAYTLQLLHRAYMDLKDWQRLHDLFPSLSKYKVFAKPQLMELEKQIYINLLFDKKHDFIALHNLWLGIPRGLRRTNEVLLAYAEGLMQDSRHDAMVEKLLRYALKKGWNEKLMEKYGMVVGTKPIKQLAFAEWFLNEHRNSLALLLSLGRICKKLQLWGKSQNYFEICSRLKETAIVYQELGQLMDLLNNKEKALEYYRKALQIKQ
jgi:HemY protein